MKINLVHVTAALGVIALAYMWGKKKATLTAQTTADANIQAPAEWWSYAGMWNAQ
jgi:hypothetical protein